MTNDELQTALEKIHIDLEALKVRAEKDHVLFNERMDRHHEWLESFQNRMDRFQMDMIEFREASKAQHEDIKYLKEAADTWLQGLEVWAASLERLDHRQERLDRRQDETDQRLTRTIQTVQSLAESHVRADQRLTRVEETVQQLAVTVDRYLNARFNGQN